VTAVDIAYVLAGVCYAGIVHWLNAHRNRHIREAADEYTWLEVVGGSILVTAYWATPGGLTWLSDPWRLIVAYTWLGAPQIIMAIVRHVQARIDNARQEER